MADPTISDLLLKTAVGVKLNAGVDACQIRRLIERFAAVGLENKRTGDIIGFLWIEDVPQKHRGPFLAALADLAAPADGRPTSALTTLQMTIDRLRAEHQSALDAESVDYARALRVQIDGLIARRRHLVHRQSQSD